MKCLTSNESSDWLRQHGIPEAPYEVAALAENVHYIKLSKDVRYIQFKAPSKVDSHDFVVAFFAALGAFEGALLTIGDWHYDPDYEVDPTSALRLAHGEQRPLSDASGFLFDPSESSVAIGLVSLVLERYWTAYLYSTSTAATALLWEGELIDFWCYEDRIEDQVIAELTRSGLRVLHRHTG